MTRNWTTDRKQDASLHRAIEPDVLGNRHALGVVEKGAEPRVIADLAIDLVGQGKDIGEERVRCERGAAIDVGGQGEGVRALLARRAGSKWQSQHMSERCAEDGRAHLRNRDGGPGGASEATCRSCQRR